MSQWFSEDKEKWGQLTINETLPTIEAQIGGEKLLPKIQTNLIENQYTSWATEDENQDKKKRSTLPPEEKEEAEGIEEEEKEEEEKGEVEEEKKEKEEERGVAWQKKKKTRVLGYSFVWHSRHFSC